MGTLTSLGEWSYLRRVSLSGGQLIRKKLAGHSTRTQPCGQPIGWRWWPGMFVRICVVCILCRIYIYYNVYIYTITWRQWQYAYHALADALCLNRSLVRVSLARNGLSHERSRWTLGVIFFCALARAVCVFVRALLFVLRARARCVYVYTHIHTYTHTYIHTN